MEHCNIILPSHGGITHVCAVWFFLESYKQIPTHPRLRTDNRWKWCYHQSLTWWVSMMTGVLIHVWMRDYLRNILKASVLPKANSIMGDGSWKLKPWNSLQNLQATWHIRGCLFKTACLMSICLIILNCLYDYIIYFYIAVIKPSDKENL